MQSTVTVSPTVVAVSPKFQVVIPKEAREALGLAPSQKLVVFVRGKQILMIPVDDDVRKYRGIFPRMDLSDVRDHTDRF